MFEKHKFQLVFVCINSSILELETGKKTIFRKKKIPAARKIGGDAPKVLVDFAFI